MLAISRLVVDCSPQTVITSAAGTIASKRAPSWRIQRGTRRSMKPSITICPARVPVIEAFCPEARSATANNVLAALAAEAASR